MGGGERRPFTGLLRGGHVTTKIEIKFDNTLATKLLNNTIINVIVINFFSKEINMAILVNSS